MSLIVHCSILPFFVGYEQFKMLCARLLHRPSDSTLPVSCYLFSGASAGGLASFLTNPLDMAKLRIQVQRSGAFEFGYKNIFHGLKCIVQEEGFKGLWKGAGARMAFHVPSTALTIAMFDTLKDYFTKLL
jgi:hypothetical protein